MSWFEGIVSGLLGPVAGKSLTDVGGTLFAFFDTITNGKMWRSLGWLLLGLVLTAVGLTMWLKTELS